MAIIETIIVIIFGIFALAILLVETIMLLGFYAEWKSNKGQILKKPTKIVAEQDSFHDFDKKFRRFFSAKE